MKFHTKLLAAAMLLGSAQAAFAVDLGTDASTPINNSASVSFSVGGVPQTAPADGTANFVVDRKVDVIVDAVSGDTGAPLATNKSLEFDVTNKTNDTMDFLLSLEHVASPTDQFDADNTVIWVDTNGNGTLELTDPDGAGPGTADTAQAYIDDLAEDATIKVWIVGDIPDAGTDPGEVADGDESTISLIAQAADPTGDTGSPGAALTETLGADDPNAVDNVFADGAGTATAGPDSDGDDAEDGFHSDSATFTVGAASVAVSKTMTVICENSAAGVCDGTTPNYSAAGQLKPIPGALIQYCILVSNTGGQAATDVAISDPVDTTNLTWVTDSIKTSTSATCDSADAAADYAAATAEDDNDTGEDPDGAGPLTTDEGGPGPTGDLVGADFGQTAANTVTASAESVAATTGKFAVIFRMSVK
jgi:uncharacterized repeat protein (TIGR01451 family)